MRAGNTEEPRLAHMPLSRQVSFKPAVCVPIRQSEDSDLSANSSQDDLDDFQDVEADLVIGPKSGHHSAEGGQRAWRPPTPPPAAVLARQAGDLSPAASDVFTDVSEGWGTGGAEVPPSGGFALQSAAHQPLSLHNARACPLPAFRPIKPVAEAAALSPVTPRLKGGLQDEFGSGSPLARDQSGSEAREVRIEVPVFQPGVTELKSHVALGDFAAANRGWRTEGDEESSAVSDIWKAMAASGFNKACSLNEKGDVVGLVSFREFLGSMVALLQERAAASKDEETGLDESDDASSTSSGDASKERVRRIRARKLRAFASNEISGSNLRSLFRLLDDDGSGEISPDEIRRGLVLLGLQGASDPVALSRIVCDIDDDKTGTITEGEFLAFFSQHTIASLKSLLDDYALHHCHIRATSYGLSRNGEPTLATDELPAEHLQQWLQEKLTAEQNVWLDLVGYKASTFQMLADVLQVEVSLFMEALTFKLPSVEVLASNRCVQMTAHHMTLSTRPVLTISRPAQDDAKVLAGKNDVQDIAISLEQTAILVMNEKVLMTLRCPLKPYSRDDVRKVAGEGRNPFADDTSGVQSLYDTIRGKMAQHTPDTEHLFTKGASAMSLVLLDAILTGNYDASDEMQDWEEILASNVRSRYSSALTVHLESIKRITNTFERHLAPLVDELSLERWLTPTLPGGSRLGSRAGSRSGGSIAEPNEDRGLDGFEQEPGAHWKTLKENFVKGAMLKSKLHSALADTIAQDRGNGSPMSPARSPSGLRKRGKYASIGSFLSKKIVFTLDQVYNQDDRQEFEELAEDLKALITAMQAKKERIEELSKLLAYIKTDMMNRTLYALTLITAVATPITFLTGIWGMNFQDMAELTPTTGGLGYKAFWIALSAVLFVIGAIIQRLRLFEALK